jgi:hypothetical protein
VTLLADVYVDCYLNNPEDPSPDEPYLPGRLLEVIGHLRVGLSEGDGRRLDRVVEKINETKLRRFESEHEE